MSIITTNNLKTALKSVKDNLDRKIGYDVQELTEGQKTQARKNIDAAKIGTESFSKMGEVAFLSLTKDDFIARYDEDGSVINYYYQGSGKLNWLKSWDDVTDFVITVDGYSITKSDVSDALYVEEGDNSINLYCDTLPISISNGWDWINYCESDNHYVWFDDDLSQYESFTFTATHITAVEAEMVLDKIVRPDWNQNDDLAADYIKNKPFYVDKEYIEIASGENVEFERQSYGPPLYRIEPPSDQLVLGATYIVTFDGVEYESVYSEYYRPEDYDHQEPVKILGNAHLYDIWGDYGWADTQEPFIIMYGSYNSLPYLNVHYNTEGLHTFSIVMVQYNLNPDKKYLASLQSDWNMEDESKMSYIRNKPNITKDYFVLTDSVNGYNYIVEMKNGTLVSSCKWINVNITTPPAQTEYINGEPFNPTGMVVTALCEDGSSKIIDKYIFPELLVTYENASSFVVRFEEAGEVIDRTVGLTVVDAGASLSDFTYTIEDDRTYTLTGWNGTVNGEASTECIIPDCSRINL